MDIGILLTILGLIVSILSLLFSYIFYKKSNKKKILQIVSSSNVLVSNEFNKFDYLKIMCGDIEVKNLKSSKIKLKNIGNETIDSSDIAPLDPIIISVSNKYLVNDPTKYDVQFTNSKMNVCLNKINDTQIQVTFDFMKPQDEISIFLLHDGDISISGDIKSGILQIKEEPDIRKHAGVEKIFNENSLFPGIIGVLGAISGAFLTVLIDMLQ